MLPKKEEVGKPIALNIKRKQLEAIYTEGDFKVLKKLGYIAYKSSKNKEHKFSKLINILSNENFLLQAMGRISKNKGALTKGPDSDKSTADATSLKFIKQISEKISNGSYNFKPARRIYMEKSGKKPVSDEIAKKLKQLHIENRATPMAIKALGARPLGLPSFRDKVVQAAILMILEAIFEPLFTQENSNFGFRPKLGCHDALAQLKLKAKSMTFAIEGDIKGAFDNVNHNKLIEILREKIDDEIFLKLILNGLTCGVIHLGMGMDTPVGTAQGSICSPILYNIYFHKFDQYINTTIKEKINQKNISENRKDKPLSRLYNYYSKKKSLQKKKYYYQSDLLKQNYFTFGPNSLEYKITRKRYEVEKSIYMELDRLQRQQMAIARSRQTLRFYYIRYADDWVFLINSDINYITELRTEFSQWISDKLYLTLNLEKSKITPISKGEHIRFLGFQLVYARRKRTVTVNKFTHTRTSITNRREKTRTPVLNPDFRGIFKQKSTNPTLIADWDRDRIIPRLENAGFIKRVKDSYQGKRKTEWTVLATPEIIEKYNYVIRGYLTYYSPIIDYPSSLHFLHYLFTYSCAHTLANKLNCSLSDIFKKFGKNITVKYQVNIKKKDKQGLETETKKDSSVSLITWDDAHNIMSERITDFRKKAKEKASLTPEGLINRTVDELCSVKVNWRTKYKLTQECPICGSDGPIEYHHVRHVRIGKTEGFLQVLNNWIGNKFHVARNATRKSTKENIIALA